LPGSGGDGSDVIYGGPGRDDMDGDYEDNVLYGGPGNDDFLGSSGKDSSTAGMATIHSRLKKMGSGMRSIAGRART